MPIRCHSAVRAAPARLVAFSTGKPPWAYRMSSNEKPLAPMTNSTGGEPAVVDLPTITFDSIAAGQKEVVIEYRGQQYRLRATRNGKLILNK